METKHYKTKLRVQKYRKKSRTVSTKTAGIKKPVKKKISLWEFGNKYFSGRFVLKSAEVHKELADEMEETIKDGGQYAFALPRGTAKTTWMVIGCIYAILYSYRKFLVIIAGSSELAQALLGQIKSELETNEDLEKDFPALVEIVKSIEGKGQKALIMLDELGDSIGFTWKVDKITLPNVKDAPYAGACIVCRGIEGHIRGMQHKIPGKGKDKGRAIRPDLVLIDDPQTTEDANSPSTVQKILSVINGDILGLAGPGCQIAAFVAGTVIKKNDVMHQLTDRKKNAVWQGKKSKMLLSEPVNKEKWEEYRTLRQEELENEDKGHKRSTEFYINNRLLMDDGAAVYWDARKYPDEVSAIQHAMNLRYDRGDDVFASEYQNEPLSFASQFINLTRDTIEKKFNGKQPLVLPELQTVITAAIDINRFGLTWLLLASTQSFSSAVIAYGVERIFKDDLQNKAVQGAEERLIIYKALHALCNKFSDIKIYNSKGIEQRIRRLAIDSGYVNSTVKEFVTQNQNKFKFELYASKGFSNDQYNQNKGKIKGDNWHVIPGDFSGLYYNADYWKENMVNAFFLPFGSPSGIEINADPMNAIIHRDFINQLLAEKLVDKQENRFEVMKYSWTVEGRNDFIDVLVYCRILAAVCGCNSLTNATLMQSNAREIQRQEIKTEPQKKKTLERVSYDSLNF